MVSIGVRSAARGRLPAPRLAKSESPREVLVAVGEVAERRHEEGDVRGAPVPRRPDEEREIVLGAARRSAGPRRRRWAGPPGRRSAKSGSSRRRRGRRRGSGSRRIPGGVLPRVVTRPVTSGVRLTARIGMLTSRPSWPFPDVSLIRVVGMPSEKSHAARSVPFELMWMSSIRPL